MRAVKIPALLLVLLILAVSGSFAQAPRHCIDIDASLVDTIQIIETRGKPGDIINMPFALKNTRNAVGVQMYVEIDTSKFRPIVDFVDTNITGTAGTGFDTTIVVNYQYNVTSRWDATRMQAVVSDDFDQPSTVTNILRLRVIGYPHPDNWVDLLPAIQPGTGQVITIPMQIVPTAQQLDYVDVEFYFLDVYTEDLLTFLGCQHTNYTDTTGISIRTSTLGARLVVDTTAAPVPQIISFTSTKDTVNAGESVTLAWSVSNADSVVLYSSVTGRLTKSTAATSSFTVTPSTTTAYTLTAYNNYGEANAQVTVAVRGSVINANPVVAPITPNSYTITQGENVSFSVSATDADNEFITLSALSLPANATFGTAGQVTGIGSASGNFSFTPNTTQEGTFIVGFRAADNRGGVSAQVNVTINVEAIEYDILFSQSRAGGSPVGALAGRTGILLPIDLVTSQPAVYGVQFDMYYNDDYFTVDSVMTTNRTAGWTVYDNIGQGGGMVRIVMFSMAGDSLITDETDGTTILWVAMSIDSTAPWGDHPIYLEEGWESTDPDPQYPSLALVTDSAVIQVDRRGDVNLDKRVDVADAVNIVAAILGNITLQPRQFDVADLVIDLTVDVFDLVGVINTIYGLPVEQPSPAPESPDEFATVTLAYADMYVGSRSDLVVHSELPVDIAGVQIDLQFDPGSVAFGTPVPADEAAGLTLTYKNDGWGRMTILLHFTNPFSQSQLVSRGTADLVKIPMMAQRDIEYGNEGQIDLVEVKLSTPTAKSVQVNGFGPPLPSSFSLRQNYPNPFNPNTRIEFSLAGTADHVTLDIYNVLGQHVRNLVDKVMPAGEYGVEWNATTDNGNKVATGVYLYRLQVGNRAETKKMLLLK